MRDYDFCGRGCFSAKGRRALLLPFRLLLRKLLVPIFQRQIELFRSLGVEIDALKERQDRLDAITSDCVAMTRRLAMLEDQVEALLQRQREMSLPVKERIEPSYPLFAEIGLNGHFDMPLAHPARK